jgi:hypothetical protein
MTVELISGNGVQATVESEALYCFYIATKMLDFLPLLNNDVQQNLKWLKHRIAKSIIHHRGVVLRRQCERQGHVPVAARVASATRE